MVDGPFPVVYASDGDGYAPPMLGGTMGVKYFQLTPTTGANKLAFTLPGGATIIGFDLDVQTIFDGSATLSVGESVSAGTSLLNAQSVLGTAGPVFSTAWLTLAKWFTKFSSAKPIYVTMGGSPTVGLAYLACRYVLK